MITLPPSILVSCKTALRGGVKYDRTDIDAYKEGQAAVTEWKTVKVIDDPVEFENATKARNKAAALVRRVCSATSLGLICPLARRPELELAIAAAAEIVNAFNQAAQLSRIAVYVLRGIIADNDAEALRAMANEIREQIDGMKAGIDAADPEMIRTNATAALELGKMLDETQAKKVTDAVAAARQAAREIVSRIQKKGELAANVIASLNVRAIDVARFAFLDVSEQTGETATPLPGIEAGRGAAIEYDDTPPPLFADQTFTEAEIVAAATEPVAPLDLTAAFAALPEGAPQ